MYIATWNVNSIRARAERAVAWLRRQRPDVVCLQEIKCTDAQFPTEVFRREGYHVVTHGQQRYNGVAILSRLPIEDVARGFDGAGREDEQARLIAGTIGGVRVINVYVPMGKDLGTPEYAYKLDWLRRLRQDLLDAQHSPDDPILLCGDFNVAMQAYDTHAPSMWARTPIFDERARAAMREVLAFGVHDSTRMHHRDHGLFTWWDYRADSLEKNRGLRIDFILGTAPLMRHCVFATVDRQERLGERPSDHAPVLSAFEYEGKL